MSWYDSVIGMIRGIGSAFDLSGGSSPVIEGILSRTDEEAIASDWVAVGNDMKSALCKFQFPEIQFTELKFVKSKYRKRIHLVSRGVSLCSSIYLPSFVTVDIPENGMDSELICKKCRKRWELNLPKQYLRVDDGNQTKSGLRCEQQTKGIQK